MGTGRHTKVRNRCVVAIWEGAAQEPSILLFLPSQAQDEAPLTRLRAGHSITPFVTPCCNSSTSQGSPPVSRGRSVSDHESHGLPLGGLENLFCREAFGAVFSPWTNWGWFWGKGSGPPALPLPDQTPGATRRAMPWGAVGTIQIGEVSPGPSLYLQEHPSFRTPGVQRGSPPIARPLRCQGQPTPFALWQAEGAEASVPSPGWDTPATPPLPAPPNTSPAGPAPEQVAPGQGKQ